jgi:predicted metal-binding protein
LSTNEKQHDGQTIGDYLLAELKNLHAQWPRRQELSIEPTVCLCICDQPCAVAFVGPGKPSFLFANIHPTVSAEQLLKAAEHYLDHSDGMVPAYRLPQDLQACRICRIPPAS